VARYVVVNFNVHNSNETKKYAFNIVTYKLNFAAIRMLFSQQDGVNTTFYPSYKNIPWLMKDSEDFSFLFRDLMLLEFVVSLNDNRKNGEDIFFFFYQVLSY